MTDPATNDNKVTLALLGQKMDEVLARLDLLSAGYAHDHDLLTEHTQILADRGRRIAGLETQAQARTWETRIVEMLLAIATALGLIKST